MRTFIRQSFEIECTTLDLKVPYSLLHEVTLSGRRKTRFRVNRDCSERCLC